MSKIEVNAIEPQCGTTLTIGASNTSIAGIGTVNWDTTKKTASFTAVSGRGYFVDTTSSAITVTLPASPSAGNIVSIKDYAGTWNTNNCTIARNSSNLDGSAADSIRSTKNESLTLVYVDATQGWKSVEEGTGFVGEAFIGATGGTVTTCGDYKIHTFTSPGTFTVSCISSTPSQNIVSYMVVAGGGGSENNEGSGGGGAGGFREYKGPADCYSASPLNGNPGGTAVTVSAQDYPITVGAGGGAGVGGYQYCVSCTVATNGSNSIFSTITSTGGGAGGRGNSPNSPTVQPALQGSPGGSGGGAGGRQQTSPGPGPAAPGGSGNTPPVTPAQGNNGGNGMAATTPSNDRGGGGGGATAAGATSPGGTPAPAGNGGAGATTSISGTPTAYAGGGGGGAYSSCQTCGTGGSGGTGGGGQGGSTAPSPGGVTGTNGTANTGGGGGAGSANPSYSPLPSSGSTGGSGIVIIRYKFQ